MKVLVIFLIIIITVFTYSEDELKFKEFFMFQNSDMDINLKGVDYRSKYVEFKMEEIRYKHREDGDIGIYIPEIKIKNRYADFSIVYINLDSDRIKLFGEEIKIENQDIIYSDIELKKNIKNSNIKMGIGYGKGDIKLQSSIADGTFKNLNILTGNISWKRKKAEVNYKIGKVSTDVIINKNSEIGKLNINYNYIDIKYNNFGVWYLKFKTDGYYDFDFSTVGALALAEQNYLDIKSDIDFYGVSYKNKIEHGKLKLEFSNYFGSFNNNESKIKMERIKKHFLSPSEKSDRTYELESKMPIFYYGEVEIVYKVRKNIILGVRKSIPYLSGVKINKSKTKDGIETEDRGSKSKGNDSMTNKDYLISGTMCYISVKF